MCICSYGHGPGKCKAVLLQMLVVDASPLPMMPDVSQLLHVPKKAGNKGAPFGYDCRSPVD